VWIPNQKTLIFSDVIRNTIYSWTEEKGTSVYLTPSGYTGISPRGGEPGSNGLLIDPEGRLILCQHGDRRIALMESSLNDPRPEFKTLANSYRGKKFDSPNDIVRDSKGNFYFTDPPYGLAGGFQDSTKAAPYQGVYQLTPSGNVYLLIDTLTRPNGITLSPDGRFLFVGNSDGNRARWYRYALGDTSVVSGKVFYDAHGEGGAPDGMKMDHAGNLYSTGPGGVWIFNADAKVLGKLKIPQATSNIALSDDERTLFITADSLILRLKMR
jgi:gluconolactonase